jgi:hypothetical protein
MIVRATMTAHPMAYRDTPRVFQGGIGRPDDEALRKRRHRERRVHTAIFGICFAFFLVVAVINRLRPSHWKRVSAATRSIWREAKEEAKFCAAIAFQG